MHCTIILFWFFYNWISKTLPNISIFRCRKAAFLQKTHIPRTVCVNLGVIFRFSLNTFSIDVIIQVFISFTTLFDVYHDLLNKYCRPSKYELTYSSFFSNTAVVFCLIIHLLFNKWYFIIPLFLLIIAVPFSAAA